MRTEAESPPWAVLLLLMLVSAGLGATALLAPLEGLVRLVPDDGFYYLELARRMGAGEGSTFDGLHETNGYHPLWTLLLVPLSPLMEISRLLGVRLALLIGLFCLLGALSLVYRAAALHHPRESALAPLWLGCTLLMASVYGMEAPLAALLTAALWYAIARGHPKTPLFGLLLGALGGALFLARLDAVAVLGAAMAVWAWRVYRREALPVPFLCALAVLGLTVLGFLLAQRLLFDAWLPISATLKASRQGGPNLRWLSSLMAVLGVGSAALSLLVLASRRGSGDRSAWEKTVALGTLLSMGLIAAGGGRETYNWYFTLPVLGGGALLPVVAATLRQRGLDGRLLRSAVWAAGLALLAVAVRGKARPTGFQEKIERAQWLAEHAPEGAVFAEGDCGILGYISRRPFVNLDGLTNSPAFLDALDQGQLAHWLLQGGVNALALPTGDGAGPPEAALVARGRQRGQKVALAARLVPWDPPVQDARYTLWRIEGLTERAP